MHMTMHRTIRIMTGCITLAVSTHALTATANKVIIQTNVTDSGTVTVSPKSGEFVNGKAVTLTAKPNKDSVFAYWTMGDTTPISYAPTLKVEAPCSSSDVTRRAFFRAKSSCAKVLLTSLPAQSGMVGVRFSNTVAFNYVMAGGVKFSAKGLPPGLKINANSGEITGAPTKVGSYTATVNAASLADAKTKSADPITVTFDIAALPANVAGTYNGFLTSSIDDPVAGSPVTVTVSASGKVSAKIVTGPGKTVSFSAPSLERSGAAFSVSMENAKAFRGLMFTIDPTRPWYNWQMTGSVWYLPDPCSIVSLIGIFNAQRNAFLNKPMANAAQTVIDTKKGYYTMRIGRQEPYAFGPLENLYGGGYGYLTATIGDRGSVKIAGKLADGTAVSTSSTLLLISTSNAEIPVYIPLYSKRGWFRLVIYQNGSTGITSTGDGFWSYPGKSPTATADAFSFGVRTDGARYPTSLTDLHSYYEGKRFSLWYGSITFVNYVPFEFDAKGGMALPKARKPYLEQGAPTYTYDPVNPWGVTFSVNKKTGIFTGKLTSFVVTTVSGKPKLTGTTFSYQGVLVPNTHDGYGFLLHSEKKVNSGVTYTIKNLYEVRIN